MRRRAQARPPPHAARGLGASATEPPVCGTAAPTSSGSGCPLLVLRHGAGEPYCWPRRTAAPWCSLLPAVMASLPTVGSQGKTTSRRRPLPPPPLQKGMWARTTTSALHIALPHSHSRAGSHHHSRADGRTSSPLPAPPPSSTIPFPPHHIACCCRVPKPCPCPCPGPGPRFPPRPFATSARSSRPRH